MLNFDESDLERFFAGAGLVDVRVELGADEQEVPGDRYLNQVGAPGRPTLLERWHDAFPPEDVERLAAFISERTVPGRWPHAYVTARKP